MADKLIADSREADAIHNTYYSFDVPRGNTMGQDAPVYYKLSGRYSPAAAIGVLGGSVFAAMSVGVLYGVAVHYQPFVYFNALMTLGVGYLIGKVVARSGRGLKVRSSPLVLATGMMVGIAAYYGACVGWVSAISEWQYIVVSPAVLLEVLREVAVYGAWSIGSLTFTGWGLYSVWLTEAAVLIGLATLVPYNWVSTAVFCESCGRWADDETVIQPFTAVQDPDAMREKLEAGELDALGDLQAASDDDDDHFADIVLSRCPGCDGLHVMTLRNVVLKTDKDGKVERNETPVVQNLLIDAESHLLIQDLHPGEDDPADAASTNHEPTDDAADDDPSSAPEAAV